MVVFLSSYSGKSKANGKQFYSYKLAEVRPNPDGKLVASVKDFFAKNEIDVSSFSFGDVVRLEFQPSEFFGGAPDLVNIVRIENSPFHG